MSQRIFYGSLELQERQRMTDTLSQISTRAMTEVEAQPPQPPTQQQPILLQTSTNPQLEQQQQIQAELRRLIVPTQIPEIKSQLRQLGQPVTYFGETAADRRDRLKKLLEEHLIKFGRLPQFFNRQPTQSYTSNLENEQFLYEGNELLRSARIEIAKFSLHRASLRVEKQRLRRLMVDALQEDKEVQEECNKIMNFQTSMAQFADSAGVSRGALSPNNEYYATAGGSGECKIWNLQDSTLKYSLLGHLTKAHSISFHPQSMLSLSPDVQCNVATGSGDLMIKLWNLSEKTQCTTLKGHEDRVNQVLFHQDGNHLISISYDKTWRLWDLATQQEILVQTGHSKPVYTGTLHPDGSLLFTGDLGGFGMVWDLRIGRGILPLTGHVKGILSSDFSSNGHHLATGGDDNIIRIWDLRRKSGIERIPAHLKLISDVKFKDGKYIVSASYDGSVKYWNSRDWSLQKMYQTQDNKITSVDVTKDSKMMITSGLDRKFVIWS